VARAKRTDRAEARRRYRATIVETDESLDPELEEPVDAEAPARPPRARGASAPAALPPRPSLLSAFRSSFRPIDLRGDIQALPAIAIRSKAIWLPVLLTAASAVFYAVVAPPITAVATQTPATLEQTIASLLFQYFVYTPPVASIFLAGFLAPRASYLTGLIAGLAGAIALALVAVVKVGSIEGNETVSVGQFIQAAFVVSPVSGLFFGGAAGWYKRFLNMANPNRAAARPPRPGDRNRRRDANNRPLLARRR
jgi:hypothetical protein